ncbi:KRAB-A domain-containing protein 2-like [Aphis craccivora]|uniref:KRAB-A domain-containing protein 2-like n=1 Tax=Aphis craccivora TaxID=307492 RepID=A0A6G0YE49_APHCR|nr:KRAB-A domain-containing protein 2-like [Aphis craccivora]
MRLNYVIVLFIFIILLFEINIRKLNNQSDLDLLLNCNTRKTDDLIKPQLFNIAMERAPYNNQISPLFFKNETSPIIYGVIEQMNFSSLRYYEQEEVWTIKYEIKKKQSHFSRSDNNNVSKHFKIPLKPGETNIKYYNYLILFNKHTFKLVTVDAGTRMIKELQCKYKNIAYEIVMLYLSLCIQCQTKQNVPRKGIVVNPIISSESFEKMYTTMAVKI